MENSNILRDIKTPEELLKLAKTLEGKSLKEISRKIKDEDGDSRVKTKGSVGYQIEKEFFGIDKNCLAEPDFHSLGIELKTCPLKYNKDRTRLALKEPLSLNIINYKQEVKSSCLKESALYKKNKQILFIFYIHDKDKKRSEYIIKYVFLWEIDDSVVDELEPDYFLILDKIREGKALDIHQYQHKYLTLCPKHSGKFKDPDCNKSKRTQPFSNALAEIRAFRLKNSYMNLVVSRHLNKELKHGGWDEN